MDNSQLNADKEGSGRLYNSHSIGKQFKFCESVTLFSSKLSSVQYLIAGWTSPGDKQAQIEEGYSGSSY